MPCAVIIILVHDRPERGMTKMVTTYPMVGIMPMPAGFKYKEVFRRGRPRHAKWDSFWIKHPPMSPSRWAKIFAPFDALDGFDERIAEKEVLYMRKAELSDYEESNLDQMLRILHDLTRNGKTARENHVTVDVTYFVPCTDIRHDAYGTGGRYETISGMILRVGRDSLRIRTDTGEQAVALDDIRSIACEALCMNSSDESFD